jgi:hypothetical protein
LPALASPEPPVAMPGPWPTHHEGDAAQRNAACEGCHPFESQAWRASAHRGAFDDPVFVRALGRDPFPFCRGCHAPEAPPEADPEARLGDLGVACVTCHVVDGHVLAAKHDSPAPPHDPPLLYTEAFTTDAACARCHEFPFPDIARRHAADPMQSTVTEHRASAHADVPCAGCHMPVEANGRRGHGFHVDEAMLRSAARIEAARVGPGRLRVMLVPAAAGHAFPTGDLFRRLRVSARAEGQEGPAVTRYLARHFRTVVHEGALVKVLSADDRVGGRATPTGAIVVDLDLGPSAAGLRIAWSVDYQRVEHPGAVDVDRDALIASTTPLASGVAPPEMPATRKLP